jgi:chemotaxis protein methyltransferase CheR
VNDARPTTRPLTPRPAAPAERPAGVGFQATLGRDEYSAFCEGVRTICGVDLLQYKRGQMERRINTWVERRDGGDLTTYLGRLRKDPAELDAFLDRVTINVSHLWRHGDQFTALAEHVLPELAQNTQRPSASGTGGRIRAWSAGSSYGAEAYTIAAVAREAVPDARVEIRGTDLDKRMVERARKAEFSAEDMREVPAAVIKRHFEPLPDGGAVASRELQRMVRFDVGDLLRMRVSPASFELILCRNTVIYFTEEVRDALHTRLADALVPGGYLVVGASERVADPRALNLTSPFPFIYRKA